MHKYFELFIIILCLFLYRSEPSQSSDEASINCYVFEAGRHGLGSNIVYLSLALAHIGTDSIYLDYSKSPYSCCNATSSSPCFNSGWEKVFQGDIPKLLPKKRYKIIDKEKGLVEIRHDHSKEICYLRTYMNRMDLFPPRRRYGTFKDKNICEPSGRLCKILLKLWQPANNIKKFINKELDKYGLRTKDIPGYSRPIIAIQLRGGDKISSKEAPSYKFHSALSKLSQNMSSHSISSGGTCILLGDDSKLAATAIPDIKRILGCKIVNRIPKNYQHFQWEFNVLSQSIRCTKTKELLSDIEIIAHADAIIGMSRSNVIKVAVNLKRCREGIQGNLFDWEGIDIYTYSCDPFYTPNITYT